MQKARFATLLAALMSTGCAGTLERDLAWQVKPHLDVHHGMQQTRAQYELGRYYQGQGRNVQAEMAYRKALAADPEHTGSINALASLLAARGELAEASRWFEKLLTKAPESAYLHNNAGYALQLQGRHAEAVAELKRAVALDPGFERAWVNLETAARAAGMAEVVAMAERRGATEATRQAEAPRQLLQADVVALSLSGEPPAFDRRTAESSAPIEHRQRSDAAESMPMMVRELPVAPVSRVSLAEADPDAVSAPAAVPLVAAEAIDPVSSPGLLRVGLARPELGIDARLEISNGNGIRNFASRVGDRLKAEGLDVRRITNYDSFGLTQSKVEYRRGYEGQARALARWLDLDADVVAREGERWGSDVRLILGSDVVGRGRLRT